MYPKDVDDREFNEPNDMERCADCLVLWDTECRPECRCESCLRQQDAFWNAYDLAVRHQMAVGWLADMRKQGHFPAHLIAEAARKIAEAA